MSRKQDIAIRGPRPKSSALTSSKAPVSGEFEQHELSLLQEELKVRDEQLRLAEAAGIGVWDIDIATDTVRGNAPYFRIMGLDATNEAVPMVQIRTLRISEDKARVVEGYVDAVASGAESYENEYRIRRPDGELRWIFGRGRVVRNEDGRPVRYSGVDIDITEQKQAADAAQRLAAIVESSQDAIVSKDLDGHVTSWNPAAEQLFGYCAGEMIGKSIKMIIPDSHHPEEDMILARIRRGERIEAFDTVRRAKSGTLLDVSLTVSPIRSSKGTIVGASKIARDISSRKEAEQRINMLMAELSHRVKNQFAVVLSMVRESGQHAASQQEFEQLLRQRILALSRSHDLLIHGKWIGATLSDLVLAQLEAFSSRDALIVEGPDLILSPTAVQYLGMAFHELATNAVKHGALSSPNGRVHIRWRIDALGEPRLKLEWRERSSRQPRERKSSGFGSTVLEKVAPGAVSGAGRIAFDVDGLTWMLDAPLRFIQADSRGA